jgi:Flp pilus assembly protein TadD
MLTTRNPVSPRSLRLVAAFLAAVILSGCTPPGPKALLDGERLLQQGKPVDAIRRFRTAVEFLPGNAQAWNHLGLAYHLAKQPAEAAEAYQQAARLDRNLAAVFYNLGCLRLEIDDPGRAGEALRTHVGLDPKSLDGWRRLGQAQLRLQQWDQAERSYLAALKLSPQDPEALNGLGVSYQQRRRARDAWQCFSQVTTKHPDFAPAWYNLGIVAHQAGARSQAMLAFNRYRHLAPSSSAGLGLDALLRHWSAAEAAANAPTTHNPQPPQSYRKRRRPQPSAGDPRTQSFPSQFSPKHQPRRRSHASAHHRHPHQSRPCCTPCSEPPVPASRQCRIPHGSHQRRRRCRQVFPASRRCQPRATSGTQARPHHGIGHVPTRHCHRRACRTAAATANIDALQFPSRNRRPGPQHTRRHPGPR